MSTQSSASQNSQNPALGSGIRFGAAYYPEYRPEYGDLDASTLERDLDLMVETNFSVIRVGESVWTTWEPRDGEFNLDWLQPTLDGAHERGIQVILGTPTYAIPPWLWTKHPEVAGEPRTGQPMGWGMRQEVDFTHPAFLEHAERVIRRIVERYADHPAVIGYQVDNEPGAMLFHNEGTFAGFLEWLEQTYGDVETLNREWGLVYWSHRINEWRELWRPDNNFQPQYGLAWRRYQNLCTTKFIGWQADIVREYARDDQFVTTCISLDRPAMHEQQLAERLDVSAMNPYFGVQDHLDLTQDLSRLDSWVRTGVTGLLELADRGYGIRQERFLVTETNAASIGWWWVHQPPYPGQLVQSGLALVARGAAMVEYWHWHTLHFGTETYWGGVLPHSQQPGRVQAEIAELGSILAGLGDRLDGYVPDADVAILWSTDTKQSFEDFGPLCNADGSPRRTGYTDIVNAHHAAVVHAGGQARILHAEQLDQMSVEELVAQFPVLVAAAFYVARTDQLQKLRDYAAAGGHLVIGPRTGYGDDETRARLGVAPDVLAEAAGLHYEEFTSLMEPLPVVSGAVEVPEDAEATWWADLVVVDDAEVLASYLHHHFGQYPAATSRAFEQGRVSYIGTVPNRGLGRSLMRHLMDEPIASGWCEDAAVTVMSGTTSRGRVYFVHNWSPRVASVSVPVAVTDLVGGEELGSGSVLDLPAWSVRVFAERAVGSGT
ncbi:beta-galactosidase [Aestuariimicrobium ganziense]|uniref:beta-galactosidase n=1 Tax=Aestuariimicrobium ganziense TaxID=2773677 RepID=UPI00194366ED|nr:beta-galactosidase [Aestuariimicrobium ganziense]